MANLGYSFLLVLTAFLWGSTFVAQVQGNDVGPFTFVTLRCFMATALLFGFAKVLDKCGKSPRRPQNKAETKALWKAGIFCGAALFFGMNLQQSGIALGTSAGKSGFLTTCYIIFVPLISLFFGKKNSLKIWICVLMTLAGLYLLCIHEDFSIQFSDGLVLLCAVAFAAQVLIVDKVAKRVDNVRLSAIQFLVVGVLSIPPMIFLDWKGSLLEVHNVIQVYSNFTPWIPLLYATILSSGVAYTLQIVAQNKIKPAVASLLMSLESVFAALSGWAFLGETFTFKEGIGCVLMFAAVILAQIHSPKAKD